MPDDILSMLGNDNPQAPPVPEEDDALDESIDKDLLAQMLTADGEDGNFEMKKKEKEEQKPDVKINTGKIKERLGKYSKDFMDSVMKNPSKYTIETPQGRMTVKDAIMKGFDPTTGEFNDALSIEKIKNDKMAGLNENDKNVVEMLSDPSNAQMSPVDAEQYGLDPSNPMVAGNQMPLTGTDPNAMIDPNAMADPNAQGDPFAGIDPAVLQKMIGGKL